MPVRMTLRKGSDVGERGQLKEYVFEKAKGYGIQCMRERRVEQHQD